MKSNWRTISLYSMSMFYFMAGLNHWINPEFYYGIMPEWVPWHHELILISGFVEVLLAVLLLPVNTRYFGAWGIIVMLVVVFPANIQMVINFSVNKPELLWLALLRLPLQAVLIYWAFVFTQTSHKSGKPIRLANKDKNN